MKQDKAKIIEELYRFTWDSLESHLDGMYLKTPEGEAFHTKCVADYSHMISLLSKLL